MKKAVLVTGGTSGLGLELCLKLHKMGYSIITVSRNREKLKVLTNRLNENSSKSFYPDELGFYQGDISDEDFVNGFVHEVCTKYNVVGAINNACEGHFAMPTEIHSEHIEKCLKGVKGMMFISAALLREWEDAGKLSSCDSKGEQRNLRIINILSTAAQKGKKMEAAYCMAKFAQRGYTEALKDAYKDSSLKVNGVYLGGMNTNLWNDSRDYISEEKQSTFMDPAEIAEKILDSYFVKELTEDLEINRK